METTSGKAGDGDEVEAVVTQGEEDHGNQGLRDEHNDDRRSREEPPVKQGDGAVPRVEPSQKDDHVHHGMVLFVLFIYHIQNIVLS